MDCSQNDFCKSLDADTRCKLCAKCRRKFFKAQSMQMRNDYVQSCMLVLDGVFASSTSLGEGAIDHATDAPTLYIGLPGRLLNLDITFGYDDLQPAISYSNFHYLADTWVASFSHHVIRKLCEEDASFRRAVLRNMVGLTSDCCQMTALFRSNYLYFGLYHLVEILASHGQYLNQQQLASLLNHDRTSVSKAFARLKREQPDAWGAYMVNKGRVLTQPYPNAEG